MDFTKRASQTRIKHLILREYAGAWASIISHGVRRVAARTGLRKSLSLVYVDGFGGRGRYDADADNPDLPEPIWGSPILAMQMLEASIVAESEVTLSGVFVEKSKPLFRELLRNVNLSGLRTPVSSTDLKPGWRGMITVLHADFRKMCQPLLSQLSNDDFALCFVDPDGVSMPFDALTRIVSRLRTDCIILFPLYDVMLYGVGSARKAPGDQTATDLVNIRRTTEHFGSEEWIQIARRHDDDVEVRLALLYGDALRSIDPDVRVKQVSLRFSTVDRTMYYLFLTTRDADGAMRMNEILRKAGVQEYWAVLQDREQRRRETEEREGILELDLGMPRVKPPAPIRWRPTLAEVDGSVMAALIIGRKYALKDVYAALAESPYTASEIDSSIRRLRAEGRLEFDGTLNRSSSIRVRDRE